MDKKKIFEIIKFILNGGICFLLDYGFMILLKEIYNVNYILASSLGFIISVSVNYYLCILWVFNGVDKRNTNMVLFIGSSVLGLLLNTIILYFLVEVVYMHYMISKIVATLVVMVWNYIMKKKSMNL